MYKWRATYTDGATIDQINKDGIEILSFLQLDKSKISTISIVRCGDEKSIFTFKFDPSKKFSYRRRIRQDVGGEKIVCHILGYRSPTDQLFIFCFENDGGIFKITEFDESHSWFYSPKFLENE